MTIASHIHFFDTGESFLFESMKRLAKQQPVHHFILFSEKKPEGELPANCTPVMINPGLKNRLLLHYWYNYKLPGLLQRYAADIFLTENGVLSLRTTVAQGLLLSKSYEELISAEQSGFGKYRKKYFGSFVRKAEKIFVNHPYIGTSLLQKYPAISGIIELPEGVSGFFRPYGYQEKRELQQQFTNGNEYFICTIRASEKAHTTTLLKAFSIFKKWQKSGMQLVLLAPGIPADAVVDNFSLYRYKEEVKIISETGEEKSAALIASAYACIQLFSGNNVDVAGLYPLKCRVPLITTDNKNTKAVYGDAASYTALEATSLSQHMMELYRNENRKHELEEKGLLLTEKNNWENSCNLFWEAIAG